MESEKDSIQRDRTTTNNFEIERVAAAGAADCVAYQHLTICKIVIQPDVSYAVTPIHAKGYDKRPFTVEFVYDIDNSGATFLRIANVIATAGKLPFYTFPQTEDLELWSEERIMERKKELSLRAIEEEAARAQGAFPANVLEQQIDAYLASAESASIKENPLQQYLEEADELHREIVDAPFSSMLVNRIRTFVEKKATLFTGNEQQMRTAVRVIQRGFTEYMEMPIYANTIGIESDAIQNFAAAPLDTLTEECYRITFARNRRDALLGVKNEAILNGAGKSIDWSAI